MVNQKTIVVIGAGSTGLSTALNIVKMSDSGVVVVDKSFVGSGQTGNCCGFVRNYYNAEEMAFSAFESMKKIKEICTKEKDLEFVEKGLLVLDNLKNGKLINENVKMLQSLDIQASYLEEKEINKIHPYIQSKSSCAGFDEEAGYVNPQLMVNYLEKQCKDMGVKIFEKTNVTALKKIKGKFHLKTNKGIIKADKVLNATAAFTNKINKMLNFELPVKIIKINNVFFRLPMGLQKHLVAIADFVNHFYIIPHKDYIDVSTMALDLERTVDPETATSYKLDHKTIEEYKNSISKRIIGADKSSTLGGFGSCIDVTPDYYPILSKIDDIPDYYCSTGFSGTGFKHFPMIGKIMAELILERKPTYPNLITFFRFNRFGKASGRKDVSDSYFIKD